MQQINYTQPKSAEVRWEWIGHAWKLFTSDPGTWILMQLTIFVLFVLCIVPIFMIFGISSFFAARDFDDPSPASGIGDFTPLALLYFPVLFVVVIAGAAYLISGLYRTAIKQARGQSISVSDLFSGRDCFLPVLGYLILFSIITLGISLIFNLPGFIVPEIGALTSIVGWLAALVITGSMFFALPMIVDRRAGVVEAMRKSFELTRSNLIMYTIFAFIVSLLSGMGVLLCLIGVLITYHFSITVPAVAYRDVIGLPGAQNYDQFAVPPPPNYSGTPSQEEFAPPTPPQDQSQKSVVCPTCGATLLRATNFCNQCGGKL
jgi:hypothetical protein